jgi:hypothetical protein
VRKHDNDIVIALMTGAPLYELGDLPEKCGVDLVYEKVSGISHLTTDLRKYWDKGRNEIT